MFKYLSLYHDQAQAGQKLWDRNTATWSSSSHHLNIVCWCWLVPLCLPGDTFISIGQGKYWGNYICINKLQVYQSLGQGSLF